MIALVVATAMFAAAPADRPRTAHTDEDCKSETDGAIILGAILGVAAGGVTGAALGGIGTAAFVLASYRNGCGIGGCDAPRLVAAFLAPVGAAVGGVGGAVVGGVLGAALATALAVSE